MAVSIKRLRKAGLTPAKLKKYFTAKVVTPERKRLEKLISDRIRKGRIQNFKDAQAWEAIDYCYDAAYHQTTPALMRRACDQISEKNLNPDEALRAIKSWGLTDTNLFTCVTCKDGTQKTVPNLPTFYNVLVPIVKAYVTIRRAKLFNDRNQIPLLKFEPREFTDEARVIGEAVTDIVSKISDDFGYGETLKQMIFNALMYSTGLAFPRETWFVDKQEAEDGTPTVVKEGIRYAVPHPNRMAYDLTYPLSTINTDTGCEWAYFWRLMRYGDIADSKEYWNKTKISVGTKWWDAAYSGNFFQELYPCTMEFPEALANRKTDREANAAYYGDNEYDKAVFMSNMFMKLVPSKWGLGEYDYPIWFRFEIANDSTVAWCEPVPYCPMWHIGYDPDQNRNRNASFALEIVPFQECLGNILSQILLTVKQNLANLNFWDEDAGINATDIEAIKNSPELLLRGLAFVKFSSSKNRRSGVDMKQAFVQHKFVYQSTSEMHQGLSVIISIMERLLGMSPQEVGQAASHEQSAAETHVITANTSTRVDFTGTGVDAGIFAWMNQLWDACQQFLDKDFTAQVGSDIPNLEEVVKKLGFKILSKPYQRDGKVKISGSVKALSLESIISPRVGPNRIDNAKIGMVIFQAVQAVAANPLLAQAVGPGPLLKLMQSAARLAGAPSDFKIAEDKDFAANSKAQQELQKQMLQHQVKQAEQASKQPPQQPQQQQDPNALIGQVRQLIDLSIAEVAPTIVAAATQQSVAAAEKEIAVPTVKALEKHQQSLQQQQKDLLALSQVVAQIEKILGAGAQQPPPPMQPMPPQVPTPQLQMQPPQGPPPPIVPQ